MGLKKNLKSTELQSVLTVKMLITLKVHVHHHNIVLMDSKLTTRLILGLCNVDYVYQLALTYTNKKFQEFVCIMKSLK